MLQPKLEAAQKELANGNLANAETILRDIIQQKPDHPIARHMLGLIAHQSGHTETAIEIISGVVKTHQDYLDAIVNLAKILQENGRSEDAIKHYRQAVSLNSGDLETHTNLALLYRQTENYDAAIESYRHVVDAKPQDAEAHLNLGNICFEAEQYGQSMTQYKLAISLDPNLAVAHFNFGLCLEANSQFVDAANQFYKVVQLEPANLTARFHLGAALFESGQMIEAIKELEKVIAYDANNPDVYVYLANALTATGQLELGRDKFNLALRCTPDHYHALYYLHGCHYAEENLTKAAECLEKILAFDPTNINTNFFLGLIREYQGNQSAADKHRSLLEDNLEQASHFLDTWQYISALEGPKPKLLGTTHEMLSLAIAAAKNDGLALEFGVRFGASIRQMFELANQEIHGFDTFEGLPEDWHGSAEGSYSTQGNIPDVPESIHLHAGLFDDTLPSFVEQYTDSIRVMNVDCDLYSSTKSIFDHLADRIVPGTVIIFDEYIAQPHWRQDEYKAFQEAVNANNWHYEYLAFSPLTMQAVVIIQ